MIKPQRISISILLLFAILSVLSCKPSTPISKSTSTTKVQIRFKLVRNVIILPVRIGDSREFRIILDTGMPFEGLLLYGKELKDSITLENAIEVLVPGAGSDSGSTAIMADSMSFHVGQQEFTNQKLIILQTDRMKGFTSEGVTGYSLFGNYIVEIDYDRLIITLHESEVKVDSPWEWLPMTFKDNRIPWIEAAVNISGEKDIPVSLYIDLASSDALEMLVREEMKFPLPEKLEDAYLGRGLSGDIYGQTGEIHSLKLGSFYLEDVETAFAPAEIRSKQEDADGILGNNALRRFNIIFDYERARLYIKPNEYFGEIF